MSRSPARLVQSLGLCFDPLLKCLKRFIVLLPDAFVGRDRARWSRPKVMHRAAITPGPPNRAAAADTHILNGNQTAKATVEIFKYDFFIPTPTDR